MDESVESVATEQTTTDAPLDSSNSGPAEESKDATSNSENAAEVDDKLNKTEESESSLNEGIYW